MLLEEGARPAELRFGARAGAAPWAVDRGVGADRVVVGVARRTGAGDRAGWEDVTPLASRGPAVAVGLDGAEGLDTVGLVGADGLTTGDGRARVGGIDVAAEGRETAPFSGRAVVLGTAVGDPWPV